MNASPDTREADVLIIGAGLAGHCAAIEAAATGARVALLEKQPRVGGSSVLSGGSFAFAGTDDQRERGIEDSPERLEADFLAVGEHASDPALVRVYADGQLDAYLWLRARGVTFGPIQAASGQSVPRQHPADPRDVIHLLSAEIAASARIAVHTRSAARRLERDPATGRVAGVLADSEDGPQRWRALAGVILTSGGFSRNGEMIESFAPHQAGARLIGGAGNVGDGIRMAWHLGAGVRDMPHIKGTFGNHPAAGPEQHTAMLAIYKGAIAVNRQGRRFADESVSYKLLGDACLNQDGRVGYQIFDQAIMRDEVPGVPIFDFSRRIGEGLLLRADSVGELAGLIGVPPDALAETVRRYNDGVAAGHDEFGRTGLVQGFGELRPIATPPFYAYPSTSAIIATYCGVTVDTRMRVLDVFGDPIAGLYAAGEMTGGFHGRAFMTGTSLGKCVICGRIAGREAARRNDERHQAEGST